MSHNQLTGTINDGLSALQNVGLLDLSNNELSGGSGFAYE